MRPAEHLEAARSYPIEKGTPVNGEVFLHLDAVPKTAPEHGDAEKLRVKVREVLADFAEKANLKKNTVKVVKSTWTAGGFGTIGVWSVTFRNRGDRPVVNISYKTVYDSETGNPVSTEQGLFKR